MKLEKKRQIPNLALRCPVCHRTIKGKIRLENAEHGMTVLQCVCGQAFSILVRFVSQREMETHRVLKEQARQILEEAGQRITTN